ncbi:uncharacterized protein [Hetaerina americana]|uniref:uncharacterized protein n=1 Tax=Hetaerina americana TaxID=62018 RepID=UPI003A7F5C55
MEKVKDLSREGIIVFDGESEKTPSGFQVLSDTYEGDVASKSVANDTVASDVSDDIGPCIEPSAECDMLRSESFTSVNENNDSDCVNSNQSGDLSSDTLCSVASDADVVIGSSLSDHPSKHKGDVSQLSVKQLIEDLPQHEAGVLDNEHINTRIDVEENGNNNVDQEENSIHDRCMELKSDTRPPPLVPAKIPLVKWSQSKWEVILTIELPSMKHYSIYWKSNKILNIHASSGTPESKPCFALELPLWASINTEEFVHMPISNNTLKLILPKGFASEDWPRLLSTPNRPLWLSVDFDQLSVDADEDQDIRLNEVAQYMNSDDDDTDSEDEETGAGLRFEEINFDPYDPLD